MSDQNNQFFTCCRPRWDEPNGFLAMSSLLPRFLYKSLRSHNGTVIGKEIDKYVMRSFSHIAQIIGWNKEPTGHPQAISFIDSIQYMRIQSYYRNASVFLNGEYSIKGIADAIHDEGRRSREVSLLYRSGRGGCKFLLVVTAICIMFSQDEAEPDKQQQGIYYNNIKVGISASSSDYHDRSTSFMPLPFETSLLDNHPRLFGLCVIMERNALM